MSRAIAFSLVMAVSQVFMPPVARAADPIIHGTVKDSSTSTGVPANVYAYRPGCTGYSGVTTSDQFGVYAVQVPPGDYIMVAVPQDFNYATGYYGGTSCSNATVLSVSADVFGIDIPVTYTGQFAVSGQVTDSGTGAGVIADIYSYNATTCVMDGHQTTQGNGTYSMTIAGGDHKFAAWSWTYTPAYQTVKWYGGTTCTDATVVSVHATTTNINFAVDHVYHLTGHVKDANGQPQYSWVDTYDSASCTAIDRASSRTAVEFDGVYSLTLRSGTYKLLVRLDSGPAYWYAGAGTATTCASATAIIVGADTTREITVPATATISGTVTNASGSGVIADLYAYNSSTCAYVSPTAKTSAANGTFSLVVPNNATYKIAAWPHDATYPPAWWFGDTKWCETASSIAVSGNASNVNVHLPGSISGSVLSGGGLSADVYAYDATTCAYVSPTYATTAGDGSYQLRVPAGTYKLAAWPRTGGIRSSGGTAMSQRAT